MVVSIANPGDITIQRMKKVIQRRNFIKITAGGVRYCFSPDWPRKDAPALKLNGDNPISITGVVTDAKQTIESEQRAVLRILARSDYLTESCELILIDD